MYADIDSDNEDPVQLEFDKKNDHLNLVGDKDIKKIISTEKFLFSDKIYKKNKFGINQGRNMVMTDNAIYNLKDKKVQRRFDISKLKGITVSIAEGNEEFVIHGNEEEHDYLYLSKNKYMIIYLLEGVFQKLRGKELDFIYTSAPNLKNRMTTKKEKKANPKFSRMDDSELCNIKEFLKRLYYNQNGELVYIEEKESDMDGTEKKSAGLTPLIKPDNTNGSGSNYRPQSLLASSAGASRFSRKNRFTLSNYNTARDEQNDVQQGAEDGFFDDNMEYEGDEANPLTLATIEEFKFICCIGKGRNSLTFIAQKESNGVFYAVKVTDKEKLLLNKSLDNLKIERKILTSTVQTNNKNIIKMISCFQTFDKIYYVYPFYRGGDLLSFMEKNGGTFSNRGDLIYFYVCQIVNFFIKLHQDKVIYRNLKPENILIDDKGNLKMTDFSKSKILAFDGDRGLSLVGAPEYMAPEVIAGTGHKYEADWWTLGILIYQMIYGYTPFEDEYIDKIYQKILYANPNFDSRVKIDPNLKDLILKLLEKEETKRINDYDIKQCAYFRGKPIDWEKVGNFEIECPLKPNIDDEKQDDLQNFDPEFTSEKFNNDEIKCGESLAFIKSADSYGMFDYFH